MAAQGRTAAQQETRRRRWRWLGRGLTVLFIALVGWLVVSRATAVDWPRVAQSLREMRISALFAAALLAAASYAIYACFDWFARIYTKQVPKLRQFEIAWVSYAFNLNLGSLVGSVGFRYRLYARSGVEPQTIARIVATSMITNWSGYFLLGSIVFTAPARPAADRHRHARAAGRLSDRLRASARPAVDAARP
jgi:uncharacterized membrane protein YbhN (UPF0104 family)